MATVRVKVFSVLRDALGAGVVEVDVGPLDTVQGLFNAMFAKYSKRLRDVLVDPETGEMTPFMLIVNGEAISSTLDRERRVKDGDEISIIFPIGGG